MVIRYLNVEKKHYTEITSVDNGLSIRSGAHYLNKGHLYARHVENLNICKEEVDTIFKSFCSLPHPFPLRICAVGKNVVNSP